MNIRWSLLENLFYWLAPASAIGWGGLLTLLLVNGLLLFPQRSNCSRAKAGQWKRWLMLILLMFPATFFLGVSFTVSRALPLPDLPQTGTVFTAMLFASLPWMLAAGWLGPCAAFFLAFLAGVLRLPFDSHLLAQPLLLGAMATLFAWMIRQNYRGRVYAWMRRPWFAALLLAPVYAVLYVIGTLGMTPQLAAGLDYAFSNVGMAVAAFALEAFLGGVLVTLVRAIFPSAWLTTPSLQPSPFERKLTNRFIFGSGAILALLLLSLLIGDWVVAGQAARLMLRDRMQTATHVVAESVPFFLETGQNLALRIAAVPELATAEPQSLESVLAEQMLIMPYFDELLVLSTDGTVLAAYPREVATRPDLQIEEISGLPLAIAGVTAQVYAIPPRTGTTSARVSFIVPILSDSLPVNRVLVGRSSLVTNPIMQPLLASLRIDAEKSAGYLLDEYGRVLFSSQDYEVMSPYPGARPGDERFFSDTAPNGARQMVYYQPTLGRDWSVVVTIPAEVAQELALNIAMPLLGMILLFGAMALVLLQIGLRTVTGSLEKLAEEANLIAEGNLEHPLMLARNDELGRLAQAFEQMRQRLKKRMDELNRLLQTSQGMVSSLQLDEILQPVLRAVKKIGADAVGVTLADEVFPETLSALPRNYYDGDTRYAYLGTSILEVVRGRDILTLENPRRVPLLNIAPDAPAPGYLLALALRQGQRFYGALWLAFEKRSNITDDEIRFVSTLAADVALAVSNALLFQQAEEGRQYLEAVLSSTVDPVLVTDAAHQVRLLNPAAAEAFGLVLSDVLGKPVEQVFPQEDLVDLLRGRSEKSVAEVSLGEQVYLATVSSVHLNDEPVGRVCILRDVTYLKQMDQMKSDFVSTVSHDLRSPLTLMRGYATMLEMVGELNEQQRAYLRKIVVGVENMTRLVNNLLDLGRIEAGVGLEKQKVLVSDLVEKIYGALQLYANQKNIQLKVTLAENIPAVVYADEALLYQAIYNLTENAIKYTPENGRVLLLVERMANDLVFAVQDDGIGISPEDQKHLFQKFFRSSDRQARAQKGTGLGLAIVRSIAERHQGRVWVKSKLGEGSTFYLAIPIENDSSN